MGDVVTCKAVLRKSLDRTRPDYLFLSPAHRDYREIPCKPKGAQLDPAFDRQAWEYESRDGKLHLTPSLLCTDTGFHTAFAWSVDFAVCPPDVDSMAHFFAINPDRKP